MHRLSTQKRLFLLTVSLTILFIAGLIWLYQTEEEEAAILLNDQAAEKARLLEILIWARNEPSSVFVYDYSYWDEMVDFVHRQDTVWAAENLEIGLTTFQTEVLWVYDTNWRPVYSVSKEHLEGLCADATLPRLFQQAFERNWFSYFGVQSKFGLLEIRTAPIQPSSDNERVTAPRGIFVIGKLWDNNSIVKLENDLGAKVSILLPDSVPHVPHEEGDFEGPNNIHVNRLFVGVDGRPIAELHACSEIIPLGEMRHSELDRIMCFAAYAFAILLIPAIIVRRWVGQPLEDIIYTLQESRLLTPELKGSPGASLENLKEYLTGFLEHRKQLVNEIVERTRAEESLRSRENLLHATIEATADGILVVNSDGVVTLWNSRFIQLWRIPKELVETKDDNRLIQFVLSQLKDPQAFVSKVQELYASTAQSFDMLEFNDGRVLERYSCPLTAGEKLTGRVWSFHDITDRIKAEEARTQLADKLQRAERMESLGVLAGGVAHDLNNMLGPVVGYSELLLRELPPDSKTAGKVRKITKSAEDAAAVIGDLLTMARRGRCELKPLQVTEIITEYVESPSFERLRARFPRINVQTVVTGEIGLILGSAPHLSKVIMNLVTNACEAMPADGAVTIRAAQQYVERLPSGYHNFAAGEYIVVSIADTGVGIPPEAIKRIFEPYFSTKQMGHSGSGLGLAVVYGIVKDHHGYYDIISQPGQGTEFLLYFPVTKQAKAEAVIGEASLPHGTERILVVDDSPEQREMASELLGSLGYKVATAENGHEALKHVAKESVDLVLLDMIMEPGFDGLDTYEAIRTISASQKVVIVSGFSATARVQQMQSLGAGQYVKKPYSLETLARAVHEELGRERLTVGEPAIEAPSGVS